MTDCRWYIIDTMMYECMVCGMCFHFSYKAFRKSTRVVYLCEWTVTYTAMLLVPDEYNAIQVRWSCRPRCNTNDLMLKESVLWACTWNVNKSLPFCNKLENVHLIIRARTEIHRKTKHYFICCSNANVIVLVTTTDVVELKLDLDIHALPANVHNKTPTDCSCTDACALTTLVTTVAERCIVEMK
jgi:hypothetical protein